MIDTIVLMLTNDKYQIINNNFKSKSPKGIYKPHIYFFRKNSFNQKTEQILKIELSLPKLFFGNNFNELQYKDFLSLNKKLVAVLQKMGIQTTESSIANAQVIAIHYSKNIPLTDGSTPFHYINKIKSANVQMSLDTNKTDFRNDGHSYKWHCNSYEVVFYDKIKDLENAKKSGKRAVETKNDVQLKLINKLRSNGTRFAKASQVKQNERIKPFELLRMEVRLNKRAKIRQLFKKLNLKTDLTFKKLFKPAISKKILMYYLDEIEGKRSALLDIKIADYPLLVSLFFNNPQLKLSKILQIIGLKKVLETMTIREFRNLLKNHHQRGVQRLFADISKVNLPKQESSLKKIRECLARFKPIRI